MGTIKDINKLSFTDKQIERFWNKVNKTDTCWLWIGSTHGSGYGKIYKNYKTYSAHRIAFMLTYPEIYDSELDVLHNCDVPKCVKPDHLYQGTHSDNMREAVRKGRHQGSRMVIINRELV